MESRPQATNPDPVRAAHAARVYETAIRTSDITEYDLQWRSSRDSAAEIRKQMDDHGFDVMPIRDGGRVKGYVRRKEVKPGGSLVIQPIEIENLIAPETPLNRLLPRLAEKGWFFVLADNRIAGIVTTSDLEKHPARVYLFGVITLAEAAILDWIRKHFSEAAWEEHLNPRAVKKAQGYYRKAVRHNSQIHALQHCSFAHKLEIMNSVAKIRSVPGWFPTKPPFTRMAAQLRNNIAHGLEILNQFNRYVGGPRVPRERSWLALSKTAEQLRVIAEQWHSG